MRPYELMEDLGWTGNDVWFAHGIHLSDAEVDQVAETKTGRSAVIAFSSG